MVQAPNDVCPDSFQRPSQPNRQNLTEQTEAGLSWSATCLCVAAIWNLELLAFLQWSTWVHFESLVNRIHFQICQRIPQENALSFPSIQPVKKFADLHLPCCWTACSLHTSPRISFLIQEIQAGRLALAFDKSGKEVVWGQLPSITEDPLMREGRRGTTHQKKPGWSSCNNRCESGKRNGYVGHTMSHNCWSVQS